MGLGTCSRNSIAPRIWDQQLEAWEIRVVVRVRIKCFVVKFRVEVRVGVRVRCRVRVKKLYLIGQDRLRVRPSS